jgi:hypothetical protein
MQAFIERIEKMWCETMHSHTMWPIHGKYRCAECFREYPVAFNFDPESRSRVEQLLPHLDESAPAFTRTERQIATL